GAVRVLCKPFTRAELLACVRQAIECETGYRGSIHGLSLVDVLQMFHYARRSVAIRVDGASPGRLVLREGQLVHADYQGRQGEAALAAILASPTGSRSRSAAPDAPDGEERTIARDFREVLLDALRAHDEQRAATAPDDSDDVDVDLDAAFGDLDQPP